jgi:acetyltransferase-like isoleucine patch superfamily enzyme
MIIVRAFGSLSVRVFRFASNKISVLRFLLFDGVYLGVNCSISLTARIKATDGGKVIIGKNVSLGRGVSIVAQGGKVSIGDNCFIGDWSTITSKDYVEIGPDSLIAERVSIRDQNHSLNGGEGIRIKDSGFSVAPIVIGTDVWLSAGVVVLKGVNLGSSSVVGANAVVVANVEPMSIVGGVPARLLKKRNEKK